MFTFKSLIRTQATEETRSDTPRRFVDTTVTVTCDGRPHVCVLRDVSPKGAGLIISFDLILPNTFNVKIDDQNVPARVVWRKRNRVGVRLGTEALSPLQRLFARISLWIAMEADAFASRRKGVDEI